MSTPLLRGRHKRRSKFDYWSLTLLVFQPYSLYRAFAFVVFRILSVTGSLTRALSESLAHAQQLFNAASTPGKILLRRGLVCTLVLFITNVMKGTKVLTLGAVVVINLNTHAFKYTYIPYSDKFSRHTIFADRVVGSVSRKIFSLTKEILLATALRGTQFSGA